MEGDKVKMMLAAHVDDMIIVGWETDCIQLPMHHSNLKKTEMRWKPLIEKP